MLVKSNFLIFIFSLSINCTLIGQLLIGDFSVEESSPYCDISPFGDELAVYSLENKNLNLYKFESNNVWNLSSSFLINTSFDHFRDVRYITDDIIIIKIKELSSSTPQFAQGEVVAFKRIDDDQWKEYFRLPKTFADIDNHREVAYDFSPETQMLAITDLQDDNLLVEFYQLTVDTINFVSSIDIGKFHYPSFSLKFLKSSNQVYLSWRDTKDPTKTEFVGIVQDDANVLKIVNRQILDFDEDYSSKAILPLKENKMILALKGTPTKLTEYCLQDSTWEKSDSLVFEQTSGIAGGVELRAENEIDHSDSGDYISLNRYDFFEEDTININYYIEYKENSFDILHAFYNVRDPSKPFSIIPKARINDSGRYFLTVDINGALQVYDMWLPSHTNELTEDNFNVSPNPFTSQVLISTALDKAINYKIVNIEGIEIASGKFNRQKVIETASYPPGVYFLLFYDQNKVYTKKLIKI